VFTDDHGTSMAVHPIKNAAWNTDYLVKLLPLFCNAISLGSAGSVLA
jgi:hypothetical protein